MFPHLHGKDIQNLRKTCQTLKLAVDAYRHRRKIWHLHYESSNTFRFWEPLTEISSADLRASYHMFPHSPQFVVNTLIRAAAVGDSELCSKAVNEWAIVMPNPNDVYRRHILLIAFTHACLNRHVAVIHVLHRVEPAFLDSESRTSMQRACIFGIAIKTGSLMVANALLSLHIQLDGVSFRTTIFPLLLGCKSSAMIKQFFHRYHGVLQRLCFEHIEETISNFERGQNVNNIGLICV